MAGWAAPVVIEPELGDFPAECREGRYLERLKACYPIHPEVFERLYSDWSTLERFRRTRGVLRLMAAVIHDLWVRHDAGLVILPGSVGLDEARLGDARPRCRPRREGHRRRGHRGGPRVALRAGQGSAAASEHAGIPRAGPRGDGGAGAGGTALPRVALGRAGPRGAEPRRAPASRGRRRGEGERRTVRRSRHERHHRRSREAPPRCRARPWKSPWESRPPSRAGRAPVSSVSSTRTARRSGSGQMSSRRSEAASDASRLPRALEELSA